MPDETGSDTTQERQPVEIPPEVMIDVSGGVSPVEFGEAVAAFVLSHIF